MKVIKLNFNNYTDEEIFKEAINRLNFYTYTDYNGTVLKYKDLINELNKAIHEEITVENMCN